VEFCFQHQHKKLLKILDYGYRKVGRDSNAGHKRDTDTRRSDGTYRKSDALKSRREERIFADSFVEPMMALGVRELMRESATSPHIASFSSFERLPG